MVTVTLTPFVALHGWGALSGGGRWWMERPLLALAALVSGIVVHEALHALAWLVGGVDRRHVAFGINWKAGAPYAHCGAAMSARLYRVSAAVPGVVLGLAPVAVSWATGSGALFYFGLLFTLAASGDALILWLLRGVPPDHLVRDHPTQAGCLLDEAAANDEPGAPALV